MLDFYEHAAYIQSNMTWQIHQGDCVEVLKEFQPARFDACVTDPPYGERVAAWDSPRSAEWYREWMAAVDRVVVPGGPIVTFASRRYLDVVMGALRSVRGDTPECPLQSGAWVHRQGHPTGNGGFLRPEHEPFIVSGRLRVSADDVRALRQYKTSHNLNRNPTHRRLNAKGFGAITYVPNEHGPIAGTVIECARNKPAESVGHPTQKPERVMAQLVAAACAPGGRVLDPFCGSGTTILVAGQLGRDAEGIELVPEYVEMARTRVSGSAAPLFNREACV